MFHVSFGHYHSRFSIPFCYSCATSTGTQKLGVVILYRSTTGCHKPHITCNGLVLVVHTRLKLITLLHEHQGILEQHISFPFTTTFQVSICLFRLGWTPLYDTCFTVATYTQAELIMPQPQRAFFLHVVHGTWVPHNYPACSRTKGEGAVTTQSLHVDGISHNCGVSRHRPQQLSHTTVTNNRFS